MFLTNRARVSGDGWGRWTTFARSRVEDSVEDMVVGCLSLFKMKMEVWSCLKIHRRCFAISRGLDLFAYTCVSDKGAKVSVIKKSTFDLLMMTALTVSGA
jgi:hypothetical protein